jgi:hypothetical protein
MIVLSALVAHTGWHWMTDRASVLRQFQFYWPAVNVGVLVTAVVWIVAIAGMGWLAFRGLRYLTERSAAAEVVAQASK